MAARLESVGRFICDRGGWEVTNLQAQKIMYMAQMLYMGRHEGARLVDCGFEAWDYGPVSPTLYHRVKMFGSKPIHDVFPMARSFDAHDGRKAILEEVCDAMLPMRPGEMVEVTHWPHGAWAKNYVPGMRGLRIPDPDILAEYRARVNAA